MIDDTNKAGRKAEDDPVYLVAKTVIEDLHAINEEIDDINHGEYKQAKNIHVGDVRRITKAKWSERNPRLAATTRRAKSWTFANKDLYIGNLIKSREYLYKVLCWWLEMDQDRIRDMLKEGRLI